MITPVFANHITHTKQHYNNKISQPSFNGLSGSSNEAIKYVKGCVQWSRKNAGEFDRLLADKHNFVTMLNKNVDGIKDFVECNFGNPFNCKILLDYPYNLDGNRIFENADIHKGLSSISYASEESLGKLRRLFQYCTDSLLLKEGDFFPNEGIREAIRKENIDYLSFLMNERMLLPYAKNGEIDVQTVIYGRNSENPDVRQFFDNDFLMHKARRHDYFSRGLYNEPPFQVRNITLEDAMKAQEELSHLTPREQLDFMAYDGSAELHKKMRADEEHYKKAHQFSRTEPKVLNESPYSTDEIKKYFKSIVSDIRADEDKYGQAQLETLYSIANNDILKHIKDAPLNVTGGKLQHLLAEIYINPTEKNEVNAANQIIKNLKSAGANLDAFDDLGETALKRAVDAENTVVVRSLLDNGANPYASSNGANSASKAAEFSNNNDIFNLFERYRR